MPALFNILTEEDRGNFRRMADTLYNRVYSK